MSPSFQNPPGRLSPEEAEPVVSGCPRNVIGGDAGDHFFKKGALPDSPIACVYCGAKKPEGAAR